MQEDGPVCLPRIRLRSGPIILESHYWGSSCAPKLYEDIGIGIGTEPPEPA